MNITKEYKERDSFLKWFLLAAIVGCDVTDDMKREPRLLTMYLNGEEINPIQALKRLEDSYTDMIVDKASEKIEDIKNDIVEPLNDKINELVGMIDNIISNKIIGSLGGESTNE